MQYGYIYHFVYKAAPHIVYNYPTKFLCFPNSLISPYKKKKKVSRVTKSKFAQGCAPLPFHYRYGTMFQLGNWLDKHFTESSTLAAHWAAGEQGEVYYFTKGTFTLRRWGR